VTSDLMVMTHYDKFLCLLPLLLPLLVIHLVASQCFKGGGYVMRVELELEQKVAIDGLVKASRLIILLWMRLEVVNQKGTVQRLAAHLWRLASEK
jgi:hypothetical protein